MSHSPSQFCELTDRQLFLQVLACATDEDRLARLKEVCPHDPDRRERIMRMIELEQSGKAELFEELAGRVGVEPDALLDNDQASALAGSVGDSPEVLPTIRHYKLLEKIGDGGMGVVYMAAQEDPIRRTVAVKIIKPGMDSKQVIARFEAERQTLAMMNHPHIAKVLEAGTTEEGHPYFVMELVKGIAINEFCDQHQLTLDERLKLFLSVCQAVEHAHQKGVIHRDLKPSNVLVELHDVDYVPKIIDFGVAKATGGALSDRTLHTGYSQMIGTPLYMSPEQAEFSGLDVDTRSDVYSLGVMLYELVTGTTPVDKEQLKQLPFDEMCRMLREDEPLRPSKRLSTLDARTRSTVSERRTTPMQKLISTARGDLDWIVMKSLEKDRRRRYQSAASLGEDVRNYLAGETVIAHPPSSVYQLRKWLHRHRVLSVAITLVTFTLASAGALLWNKNNQTAAALATAVKQRERADQNLQFAVAAVDDMYVNFSTQWLSDGSSPSNLQHEFLQRAQDFYHRVTELPKRDERDLLQAAEAYERIARISQFLDQDAQAIEALNEAIKASRAALNGKDGARSEVRISLLRRLHLRAAIQLDGGDLTGAKADFDAGFDQLRVLRDSAVDANDYREASIDLQHGYAEYLYRAGELKDAETFSRKAREELQLANNKEMDTHVGKITNRLLLGRILLAQEREADAAEQVAEGLLLCRKLRSRISDGVTPNLLQAELLELSAQIDESTGRLDPAEQHLEEAIELRRLLSKSRMDPSQSMMPQPLFLDDGHWDPNAFYGYNRASLQLARVVLAEGRTFQAEDLLGQCMLSNFVLSLDRPSVVKHQVAEANTWALIYQLLLSQNSKDAKPARDYAILIWRETIEHNPHARTFRSGLQPGIDDYLWFRSTLDAEGIVRLDSNEPLRKEHDLRAYPDIALASRATARSWFDAKRYKAALRFFEASAKAREYGCEYDWLYLAMSHAQLGNRELADQWFEQANKATNVTEHPSVELVALLDETKQTLANLRIIDDEEQHNPESNESQPSPSE